jgi:hypothetical protein
MFDDEHLETLYIPYTNIDFSGAQSKWDSNVICKDKNKPKNWYFKAYFVDKNDNIISDVKVDSIN